MQDIADWLTQWTAQNIDPSARAEEKADLQGVAKQLVEDGKAAGFTVQQIKEAAAGDVERYLVNAQNASHIAD